MLYYKQLEGSKPVAIATNILWKLENTTAMWKFEGWREYSITDTEDNLKKKLESTERRGTIENKQESIAKKEVYCRCSLS